MHPALDYRHCERYGANVTKNAQSVLWGLLFCLCLLGGTSRAQVFSDLFAGSQVISGTNIIVLGSNTNATIEAHEPKPAGKVGGHSLWIAWQAPDNGLVTLSTAGSSFDTLLAAYISESSGSPSLTQLENVAQNDDYGGQVTSYLQCGARAGKTYYIVVDGFNGATGDVRLQLAFVSSANLQPTVVGRAGDQALRLGDPLILTIGVIPTTSRVDLQWYLNGNQISDAGEPTLVIPSLQRTNLGLYSLRFSLDDDSFFSSTIEIEVNSEGQPAVLARNKIADAALSGLTPKALQGGLSGGVVIGYHGTQIFNTTNAVVDANAPRICGVPPGAAYWFYYQAPTNGVMTIDTGNSSFSTLLAVFTYTNPLTSYTNLSLLACDNNNNGTGTNSSAVSFVTTNGGNYFIVVGGVGGARGIAHLNYSLAASPATASPVVIDQPQPLTAAANTAVALNVVADGTGPMAYQWWKNNSKIRNETNASLFFSQPSTHDSANYFVVITNAFGAITSAPANLTVLNSTLTRLDPASNTMISAFPGIRGYQYAVDCLPDLSTGSWVNVANVFPNYGGLIWVTNSTTNCNGMFMRVHTP